MLPIGRTPRYQAVIAGGYRARTAVEYSTDQGRTWTPLTYLSGTVTTSRTSPTRWEANNLVVTDDSAPVELGGVTPFGVRVRLRYEILPARQAPLTVPLGVYRLNKAARNHTEGTVTLSCTSWEDQIIDSKFLVPTTLGGESGDTARALVEGLVRAAVPDAGFIWRVDGSASIPKVHQDESRWEFITGGSDSPSIANSLGAEVYTDAVGAWVIAPVPTLYDDPVWDIARGKALVELADELSRDGVYNVVVVNGESTGSDTPPVGPGISWDDDPDSPTYAGPDPVNESEKAGPFGVVPTFHTSPLLQSTSACLVVARSMLADSLGLHKTLSLTTIANPALEVGDVVRVPIETPIGDVYESHLIDSYTFDPGTSAMTCETRATVTRLLGAGDVTLPSITEEVTTA